MKEKPPQSNWSTARRLLLYVALIIVITAFVEENNFSLLITILLSLFFIVPELISNYKPEFLAFLFINRRLLAGGVLLLCISIAAFFSFRHPFPPGYFQDWFEAAKYILSVLFQGAIVGMVTRMLILNIFYQMIRARDVFPLKVLVLIVYTVFLIMLPLRHLYFLSSYFLGFGFGFLAHYCARVSERRNASFSRLAQNLLSMIEIIKQGGNYKLTSVEEDAVHLYAKQKWTKLKALFKNNPETEILFFIKLCMLRKLHQYDAGLNLISEKELTHPEWYQNNEHFFCLLRALNQNEKTDNRDDIKINKAIVDDFMRAVSVNDSCLLSNASLALKLANEIDLGSVKEGDTLKKEMSLKHIWRAMTIYEERDKNPKILSLVAGLTIPFTYSFLLDTYGYVLLKNGRLRFSKALFIQCVYQDATFSPSYLHLAEWFREYYKNHENDYWKKAARLNLYIAIYNEKVGNKGGNDSFISDKAKEVLRSLNNGG